MTATTTLKKSFVFTLITVLLSVSIQAPAMAGMINNEQLALQSELQIQRDAIRAFIARDDVRTALLDYGVSSTDVDARIDNLSESELLQIQDQLAAMPAGGDGVLGAILVVILIFVLLDVLGATDVFPNV